MKNLKKYLLFVLLLATLGCVNAQIGVGKWRDHLSYTTTYKVLEANHQIWCSVNGGLFYYDLDDNTLNRVNKTTGLTDVGISTFNYDPQTNILVVAYSNSNIDLIKDNRTVNISDIKRANINGNKSVNSISFYNRCAYLACGFGIVVVDLSRDEIKETYYLGNGGSYLNINDIAFTDSLIVAATDSGLIYADKRNRFLNIIDNWTSDETSLLAGSRVTRLAIGQSGRLVATAPLDTTVYIYHETASLNFEPWLSGPIRNISFSNNKYLVCNERSLEIYNGDRILEDSIGTLDWMTMEPNDAIIGSDGNLWVAHTWASLAHISLDSIALIHTFSPSGPGSVNTFRLMAFDKELMVCPGGHTSTFAGSFLNPNVYTFKESKQSWKGVYDDDGLMNGILDIIDVAVNPRNSSQKLAAAWGYGIVELTDNKVTNLYNASNTDSVLTPYSEGNYTSLRTGGVAFDSKGNAWVTNSLTSKVLIVRRSNGTWQSFDTRNMISGGDIDHILWDSINDFKLFWGHSNRIYVHDGNSRMAYIDPNNGSRLQSASVSSLVQDHKGNLWMGTNKGIKVIYNLANAFNNGGNGEMSPVTCNNIIFNANGITEYLMAYENVTCIAVDGANRKWVGTATGGLYLLSENGLEELQHFTASNSPLFSDKIICLAIMPWSGELFIGTDKGLQSYRSTATYAFSEPQEDIHAFPNPVRPDYTGEIAIKGFSRNALVHITDANGNTVFSTRANGGQAIWNGCTNSGSKVASGVYYVFASSEDGTMRSVTKILVIR